MREIRSWCGVLVLAGLLVGCGSGVGSSGTSVTDPLTFQNSSVPVGYVGENYSSSVAVLGGVGAYAYRVSAGELPPGITLSGSALQGKPTRAGTYKFSIEANDANLSNKVMQYTLNVSELPPLSFELQLPPAEIRGETRVPLLVRAPRNVRAARVQWDVGKNVQVTQVQPDGNSSVVFWKQDGALLTVDFGFKTVPKPDARLALLSVKPGGPVTLNGQTLWYEARDGQGKLLSEKKAPAPAVPATNPAPAATPSAPATGTTGTGTATEKPTTETTTTPDKPAPTGTDTPVQPGGGK